MSACLVCLRPLDDQGSYHVRCARRLFGTSKPPAAVDIDLAKLHTVGLAMVGRTSLSGVQRKISVNVSSDKQTLQVALGPGRYILKPQATTYPELPQNELLTMRLAESFGVEVPDCGLVHLADRSLAYVVRRFDRPADGGKLRQEDFCQLAVKPAKEKYDGAAELCARLVKAYASEPLIELLNLFRLVLVSWVTGNGDMHLKNFSLLAGKDNIYRLSPAYDLVCTRLVIADDQLALPVAGKRDRLTRSDWIHYGGYCGLRPRVIERILGRIAGSIDGAQSLIADSLLSDGMKAEYSSLVAQRGAALA
jgi:serine/threonine-protein kinase HipA